MTALALSDVAKRFGPTIALDGVNLQLRRGEVHALIGENGAGKSTLMNILAGALHPDRGRLEIDGQVYSPASPLDARERGIALIHQELSLAPHLTVAENILMGLEPARWGWLNREAARRKSLEVLESFHHPEIRPDRRVADLPLAARQVVEICRAVAARANIILMDEPTSSLQRDDVAHLFALIHRLRDEGISIVYISHFLEEIREIADSYTVLRDGRSVSSGALAAVSNGELIVQMVGRPVENLFPARERLRGDQVLLEVRDLSAPPHLREAGFSLHAGEILGVAGLMGSGRTEMVRAIFGLDSAQSGKFKLRSKTIAARGGSPTVRLSQGLGYLSEDRQGEGLAPALSIADNTTMTRFASCARWGWLDHRAQRKQTGAWIRQLAIKSRSPLQATRTLSGGNQQKVALARLLHQNADVLLLDEPTRGIDIGSKAQIYEAIAQCASEKKAVLMVSSYLPELFGMCDRIAVMSRGKLTPARAVEDWTPETVMLAAIGGEELPAAGHAMPSAHVISEGP
ncbi:MAG: ribose transport system ATP-binding protein [Blastocatellia bacterium]|jgi:ribose transport system ATP-binding protein|nr:ribose transport system ATP-binding protein [Blastocatellia bacterium]